MQCIVCQSEDTRKFLELRPNPKLVSSWGVPSTPQTLYQCPRCGLQFTDRVLSRETGEGMYAQSYHEMMTGTLGESEGKTGVHEQSQLRLELVKSYCSAGEMLDVGCSTGVFLEKAQQAGYEVYGLDPSVYACQVTRKRLGLGEDRILHGSIHEAAILDEKKFDLITAWDVIEHCAAPKEDMKKLIKALKPGGILVLRTPNTSSIFFRAALLLDSLSRGRVRFPLFSLYHADHLVFFNPSSLRCLLKQFHLTTEKIYPDPLLWKRFKYCECRRGFLVNLGIAALYFTGRAVGSGHGMIAVARK